MTKFDTKKEKFFKTPVPKDISVDDVKYLAGRYGCDWKEGANHSRVIFDPEKYSDCPIHPSPTPSRPRQTNLYRTIKLYK